MSDGRVIIDTLLDSSGFEKGISKLTSAAKTGGGIAARSIAAAGTALTAAAGIAIKAGIDFESAFAGVKKTVDATDKQLETLRSGIRAMSKEMPTAATEIAGVAEAAGQLGIQTDNILSFSKTMVMLGDSTNMSADEAATALARLANITGMSQQDFDRLGSTVVALGNNLATTESEIVEMSLRIAGAGKQVGLTEAQIMSFAGALSSVGIEAEAGGTAISTLMSKMNLATAKGGADLERFAAVAGMTGDEFKAAFEQDAAGAILAFIQGLDRINKEGGSAIATLDEMGLSDIRMRDALLRASGASDVFTNALKIGSDAWEENTALTKEAEQRYETMASKLAILKNSATDLGISIYDSVDNPLRAVVNTATDMIASLQKAFDKKGFEGLAAELGTVIADAVTQIAKAAPKMISAGADTIKAFLKGIKANAPALRDAAADIVKALADGVASLLPKELGNACKALISVAVGVAKPLLTMAGAALKAASALSGLAVMVVAAIAAYKGYKVISAFVKTLALVRSGAMFAAQSITAMTVAQKANTVVSALESAKNVALAGTTTAMSLAQKAATVSTNLLNAALTFMGGPIGLVVAAIGLLVGGVAAYCAASGNFTGAMSAEVEKANELAEAQKELSKTIRDNKKAREEAVESAEVEAGTLDFLYQKLEELNGVENKSAAQKAQLKSIVDELNEAVPDLNLAYDEEADALNKTTDEIYKQISAQKSLVMAKAAQEQMSAVAKDMVKVEMELADAEEKRADTASKLVEAEKKLAEARSTGSYDAQRYAEEVNNLEKSLKKQDETIKNYKDELNGLDGEYEKLAKTATKHLTSGEIDAALEKLCTDAGIKMKDLPKGMADAIKEGSYQIPQSVAELNDLISYQDLVNKAKEAGIEIPEGIAEGAASGGENLTAAVTELKGLVDFQDLIDKVKADGIMVPQNLINGVNEGKLPIPTTMAELNNLINFNKALSDAGLAGKNIPKFLSDGLMSGSLTVDEATKQLGAYITFQERLDEANRIGAEIPKGLAEKVKNGKVSVEDAQKTLNKAIKAQQDKLPGKAAKTGSKTSASLKSGISGGSGSVSSAAKSVVDAAKSKMGSVNFAPVGKGISDGTRRGMDTSSVIRSAASMAKSALNAAKKALGIKSPSRAFRYEVGAMAAKGCALGIDDESKAVSQSVEDMMDDAVNAADTEALANKLSLNPAEIDAMYERAQNAVILQASKVPAPVQEFISKTVPYEDTTDGGEGNVYEIHLHTHIGAKEVAEETVVFNDEQLGKRNKHKERGHAG